MAVGPCRQAPSAVAVEVDVALVAEVVQLPQYRAAVCRSLAVVPASASSEVQRVVLLVPEPYTLAAEVPSPSASAVFGHKDWVVIEVEVDH